MRANRLLFALGACAVIALGGCGGKSSVRVKQTSSTTPPTSERSTTVVVVGDSGPAAAPAPVRTGEAHVPDHAPAHGLRRKYVYRYHPDLEVYHSAQQGLYFWFEGEKWSFGASLPAWCDTFAFEDTVQITLRTDKPYTQHKYVTKAHPGYVQANAKARGKGHGKDKGKPAVTGVETDR